MYAVFSTDINRRCMWIDGMPVQEWAFSRGDRLTSLNPESFFFGSSYAGVVAEISDFRYYERELNTSEIITLRNKWFEYHKGLLNISIMIFFFFTIQFNSCIEKCVCVCVHMHI
jgi:hypothetical protein